MNKPILIHDAVSRDMVLNHIRSLNIEKKWEITVKLKTKKRTLPQNSLFHAWVKTIADFTGDSQPSMKRDLKAEFAELVESNISPGKFNPMDTSEMNTKQMTDFMDKVYIFGTQELGLFLTVPELRGTDAEIR